MSRFYRVVIKKRTDLEGSIIVEAGCRDEAIDRAFSNMDHIVFEPEEGVPTSFVSDVLDLPTIVEVPKELEGLM